MLAYETNSEGRRVRSDALPGLVPRCAVCSAKRTRARMSRKDRIRGFQDLDLGGGTVRIDENAELDDAKGRGSVVGETAGSPTGSRRSRGSGGMIFTAAS